MNEWTDGDGEKRGWWWWVRRGGRKLFGVYKINK